MVELKPCPFCGETAHLVYEQDPRDCVDLYRVVCDDWLCGAESGVTRKKEWAAKRWNRRADNEKQ